MQSLGQIVFAAAVAVVALVAPQAGAVVLLALIYLKMDTLAKP